MTVKRREGSCKPRIVTHLLSPGFGVVFGVHLSNLDNLIRGVLERVFYRSDGTPPPRVKPGVLSKLKEFQTQFVRRASPTAMLTWTQFLEYYTGRKRMNYERAVESLRSAPLTAEDAKITTFIKAEKINMTTKEDPAPRVIQPRSPRFNCCLGRYLKHLEPRLYKITKRIFGEHTIFKGLNAQQAGQRMYEKWKRFRHPVAVGLDASRFDQHVRKELLEYEHAFYTAFYPHDKGDDGPTLAWLLGQQLQNTCVAYSNDGIIRYVVDGSRMSGDMNTGLGNCLIMCALVWSLARERGVSISLANNGDDCVVIMESEDLARFTTGLAEWFWDFGFDMKVEEPVWEFEKIDFCQTSPVWTPYGYTMVRNPHNSLDKDLVSIDNVRSERAWRNSCKLIGECGLHLAGNIPVVSALYRVLYSVGRTGRTTEMERCGMWWLSRGMDTSEDAIHPLTRTSFAVAFGIPPDAQEALEEEILQTCVAYQPTRLGPIHNIYDINQHRARNLV